MTIEREPSSSIDSLLKNLHEDPASLRLVMRNFSKHSRQHPTLAKDIISVDGFVTESEEYFEVWRDAVIDLACDASDQSHIFILIKRAVLGFVDLKGGMRGVRILADLARIVPSSVEIIMKHFESSFPYWKHSHSAPLLNNFTQNALNLGLELPQLLERIIDFLTRKILLIDLSIRSEDLDQLDQLDQMKIIDNDSISSDNLKVLADASLNLSGLGVKYSQEEKTQEMEEAQKARIQHSTQIKDYLNKIDLILFTLFQFLEKVKQNSPLFREISLFILISFERNVLPALKPNFSQILIIYAASVDNFVADRFLGSLLAVLFSHDSQLSSSHLNNSPGKVKLFRLTSRILSTFLKLSNRITDNQRKSVSELLLEWIGRKIEALTLFSKNSIEISILSSVLQCFCQISPQSTHPEDPRLQQSFKLVSPKFLSETTHTTINWETLPLPLCRQFLSNSFVLINK